MGQTAIVVGAALIIALAIIWRVDRYKNRLLTLESGEREVAIAERRNAARLEELTLESRAAAENAKLDQQAATTRAEMLMDDSLAEARIDAARRVLDAHTEAEVAHADDWATAKIDDEHGTTTYDDPVDRYTKYVAGLRGTSKVPMDFDDFMGVLSEHEEV